MKIAGEYSFNGGKEAVRCNYPELFLEIRSVIESVDVDVCKTKEGKEKTMTGKILFSPPELKLFP